MQKYLHLQKKKKTVAYIQKIYPSERNYTTNNQNQTEAMKT